MKQLILVALLPLLGVAQNLPNAAPFRSAAVQFVDANGLPLAGGLLYTCTAGLSCPGNPLATYTDSTAGVQNTNPIVLDSAGRAQIWLGPQAYRLVLQDANAVQQWTQDNVEDTTLYFVNYVKTAGTATLISYTPPGANAVQETVAAKLNQTVNVLDFGAACDGTTDDAQSIQNAFIAVHAAGGGVVEFPPSLCAVKSSAINKDAGVNAYLQKWDNVDLRGRGSNNGASSTNCASGILFTPLAGTLLAMGDTSNIPRASIQNMCFKGPGSGNTANGLYLGADPAGAVTPAGFYTPHNIFNNVILTGWNNAVTYGSNAFLSEYHGCTFELNANGVFYVTGASNSGETERFYGGLFTGNSTAGINSQASGNFTFFATNMEFNGVAIEQSAGIGQIIINGNHFEGNGAVYYAVPGSTMFPRVTVYGGDVNAASCSNIAYFQVSGTNSPFLGIYDLAQALAGTDSCPLISADSIVNPTFASINITNVLKGSQLLITATTNVFNVHVSYLGQQCIGCDTTGTNQSLAHAGIQINSNPSTPGGLWMGPQTAINSAADWNMVRGISGGLNSAIESGLQHVFSNAVQLPGGITNSVVLSGAPGVEWDYYMQHTGAVSAANVLFAHSIRANNTDYTLYGGDGTNIFNIVKFVYSDTTVRIANDFFTVNSTTGVIKAAGNTGLTVSATGGACTLTFTNGILTTKGGGC